MSIANLLTDNLKSWQDLHVNSIEANNFSAENLLVDNISEKTPAHGVQCNSLFKVDTIQEVTGSHGVECNSNFKVDNILGLVGNSVRITNIDANVIDIASGTRLQVQRPSAYIFNEEYSHYILSYTGINLASGYVEPSTFSIINAGATSYMPTSSNPFRLSIIEQGVYVFNIVCQNLGILITNDGYQIRIVNNTTGVVIGNNSEIVGNGTAIGQYNSHVNCSVPLNVNDVVIFEMALSNGVSATPQNFNAELYVFRIK